MNAVFKKKRVESGRIADVARRFQRLRAAPPPGVPRLLAFGWVEDVLIWRRDWVSGGTLASIGPTLNRATRSSLEGALLEHLRVWRQMGFVHGDLSPTNILVSIQNDAIRIWFIDWLVDLQSHEGTPRYSSPEVYLGRHSFDSDMFAISQIVTRLKD